MNEIDRAVAGIGCAAVLAWLLWIGFLIWAGINIVNWLVTK